jgi:phage tail-like protein
MSESIRSVDEARQAVLTAIEAIGATDILVEWRAVYPKPLADFPQPESPFDSPTHLAIDHAGRVYVVDEQKDYVKILDNKGRLLGQVEFADQVSGKFKPTAVAISANGELLLAGKGSVQVVNVDGGVGYGGAHSTLSGTCMGMAVDQDGNPIAVGPQFGVASLPAPLGFLKEGTFITQPLDSDIEKCQWHQIKLDLVNGIPPGTSIKVSTYSSAELLTLAEIQSLSKDDWETNQSNATDFLVLSAPGRYLWIRIEFRGNGVDTPAIRRFKVYFPRSTYLNYLPAVYQADPISKDFLERFLSIFEATNASIEEKIDHFSDYLDPDGVPAEFLSWLAGWVDMIFDPSWSEETRRRLLRNSPELYRTRGTPAGLKLLLKLALNIDARILEHFRARRWLFLGMQSSVCDRTELWGNCIVNRLQLGEYSRIGDFALIGTGDPARDPFLVAAHKFSVFVDAALIKSDAMERMLRYLIESAKPAHAQYTLETIDPRFRVGMQATVGLDTQVGAYPTMVLSHCSTLGYDTLLGCDSGGRIPPGMQIGERALLGATAVVG